KADRAIKVFHRDITPDDLMVHIFLFQFAINRLKSANVPQPSSRTLAGGRFENTVIAIKPKPKTKQPTTVHSGFSSRLPPIKLTRPARQAQPLSRCPKFNLDRKSTRLNSSHLVISYA